MAGRFRAWIRRAASAAFWTAAVVMTVAALGMAWFWGARIAPHLSHHPAGDELAALVTAPHVLVRRTSRDMVEYECHCPQPVRFEDLSGAFVDVLVGTEDRTFWQHGGVDWRGLLRALAVNAQSGETRQGASTLPQQLVKMKLLTPERTVERKILEAILAREVSALLTKRQVLAAYANAAWFAPGVVGVEAAARHFFGKRARDLNLWESAVLVGMLKAPTRYNPQTAPEASARRAKVVLHALVEHGLLTPGEMDRAVATGAEPGSEPALDADFRWYIDAVRAELRQLGQEPDPGDGFVRVALFLDVGQQQTAQALVSDSAPRYLSAIVSSELDGRVRAIVGGRDYGERQWNLALQEKRQAASLAKIPAAAVALRNGFAPGSMVMDAPLHGSWPRNGSRAHTGAPVTIRHAFAQSLNAPFARLVAREIDGGVARMRGLIAVCHGDLAVPRQESVATGAFDLTPWQAAGLVASFASGRCVALRTILAVTDRTGEMLYRAPDEPGRALLPSRTVAMLDDLMHEAVAHGTGRGARIPGVAVRGKTGTGEDDRHAWFAGYGEGGPLSVHWIGVGPATELRAVSGADAARQFRAFQTSVLGERRLTQPPLPPLRPKEIGPSRAKRPTIVLAPPQPARAVGPL